MYGVTLLLRLPFPKTRLRDCVFDALFYAASGVLAALTLLSLNGGSPRLFALAAFASGAFLVVRGGGAFAGRLIACCKKKRGQGYVSRTIDE